MNISFTSSFEKRFKNLDSKIRKITFDKIEIFKSDMFHPSFRMHSLRSSLRGFWSISINHSHRIIFKRKDNGDIVFYSIGKHDIYGNL